MLQIALQKVQTYEGTRTLVTKLKYFALIHMSQNHDGSYSLFWFHQSSVLSVQGLKMQMLQAPSWFAPKFLPASKGCSKLLISSSYLPITTPLHTQRVQVSLINLLWLINWWEKLVLRKYKTQWTHPGALWHRREEERTSHNAVTTRAGL